MLNEYDTEQALASFRCGLADPDLFLVTRWSGDEAVSRPYRFEIELASAQDNIDLEGLLGARATLSVLDAQERWLPWHGIITELRQTHRDEGYAHYRAVLEPQLALLRLFRMSRVYVQADAQAGGKPDLGSIIRMVLEQCGLDRPGEPSPGADVNYCLRLTDSLLEATRAGFICQFEENSLDFLSRRLEHEGVYYWFEQSADREIVVFGHERGQQPRTALPVYWRAAGALNGESDRVAVSRFDHALSVSPRAVVLRDFSVSQPSLNLTMKAPVDPDNAPPQDRFDSVGSVEIYGTHYSKQQDGERMAALRAEEIACQRSRFQGVALGPGLRAGGLLQLHEHFRADFNQGYYVVELRHEGRQPLPRQGAGPADEPVFYQASFTVLPQARQFRPARVTSKPRVVGFISAIVVAEGQGDYAQINEHGCYRVRFLFAPTDAHRPDGGNSAWVRMATPYAGSQHGMNFPLLKGTEVLVSFLGGDPDRPVIVAAVPNEENPSIRNQDNATQPGLRTAGQNALEFEDREGAQHSRLYSPTLDTTFQLGANPGRPERSGVRMSTLGHMGLRGSSYIHQVPGVYHLEVGNKGDVDTDPEPRERLKQAQEEAMADFLDEQASLPTATPAMQMKALAARRALLAKLLAQLQALQKKQGGGQGEAGQNNNSAIAQLQALLSKIDAMTARLEGRGQDSSLASGGKEESEHTSTENLPNNQNGQTQREECAGLLQQLKTSSTTGKFPKVGPVEIPEWAYKGKEYKTSGKNIPASFTFTPIKISTSIGTEFSASLSLKTSVVFGYSLSMKYSGSSELDLRDYKKVELSDKTRITKGEQKEIILGAETRTVRSKNDKVVDLTAEYGTQSTTVIGQYQLSSGSINYKVGAKGIHTTLVGDSSVMGIGPKTKISWTVSPTQLEVDGTGIKAKGGPSGVSLQSSLGKGEVTVTDASVTIKAAIFDMDATTVKMQGKVVSIGADGVLKLQ